MLGLGDGAGPVPHRARPALEGVALLSWRPRPSPASTTPRRPIEPGRPANLCVIDPRPVVVDPARGSRARNTPTPGALSGAGRHTLCGRASSSTARPR
jgi:dihydroorotase-like cyclic amidohydrolase